MNKILKAWVDKNFTGVKILSNNDDTITIVDGKGDSMKIELSADEQEIVESKTRKVLAKRDNRKIYPDGWREIPYK